MDGTDEFCSLQESAAVHDDRLANEIDKAWKAYGDEEGRWKQHGKDLFKLDREIKIAPAPLNRRFKWLVIEATRELHCNEYLLLGRYYLLGRNVWRRQWMDAKKRVSIAMVMLWPRQLHEGGSFEARRLNYSDSARALLIPNYHKGN
ncbi:hypothetical protein EYB25_000421 [Talaromyces marneffei]|nr:uncharacterized protein EYB26_001935 [Talaromyces marneffei]KAE8555723.1 hypothetical protein EYB25_000421 [Talaromyces marneffei]QGA14282.1 hypothetical protein EYB26_001935 [Talaromyces marneffei]